MRSYANTVRQYQRVARRNLGTVYCAEQNICLHVVRRYSVVESPELLRGDWITVVIAVKAFQEAPTQRYFAF